MNMLPPKDPPQTKIYTQTKSIRMEKIFHAKGKENKSWGSNTYIHKIDFKTQAIVRDKERHYRMIRGIIQ